MTQKTRKFSLISCNVYGSLSLSLSPPPSPPVFFIFDCTFFSPVFLICTFFCFHFDVFHQNQQHHYLDREEGVKFHYVTQGPQDGTPVVLVHGKKNISYLQLNFWFLQVNKTCNVYISPQHNFYGQPIHNLKKNANLHIFIGDILLLSLSLSLI